MIEQKGAVYTPTAIVNVLLCLLNGIKKRRNKYFGQKHKNWFLIGKELIKIV